MENCIPYTSFAYFGLSPDASEEDVRNAFRKKIICIHPDKGGSEKDTAGCIRHKKKCLEYLKEKEYEKIYRTNIPA